MQDSADSAQLLDLDRLRREYARVPALHVIQPAPLIADAGSHEPAATHGDLNHLQPVRGLPSAEDLSTPSIRLHDSRTSLNGIFHGIDAPPGGERVEQPSLRRHRQIALQPRLEVIIPDARRPAEAPAPVRYGLAPIQPPVSLRPHGSPRRGRTPLHVLPRPVLVQTHQLLRTVHAAADGIQPHVGHRQSGERCIMLGNGRKLFSRHERRTRLLPHLPVFLEILLYLPECLPESLPARFTHGLVQDIGPPAEYIVIESRTEQRVVVQRAHSRHGHIAHPVIVRCIPPQRAVVPSVPVPPVPGIERRHVILEEIGCPPAPGIGQSGLRRHRIPLKECRPPVHGAQSACRKLSRQHKEGSESPVPPELHLRHVPGLVDGELVCPRIRVRRVRVLHGVEIHNARSP